MTLAEDSERATRFAPITEFDKSGIVWILSLLAGTYALLTLFVRWFIKRDTFGSDDYTFVTATVFASGAFSSTYVALSRGMGKSEGILDQRTLLAIERIGVPFLVSQNLLIVTIALAKFSVILLIRRLFSLDMERHRRWCHIMLAVVTAWGFGSILALSIDCEPRNALGIGGSFCSNQSLRWRVIGAFDAITELLIFALSFTLIYRIQMKFHRRVRVVLAFIFRIPLVAIVILNTYFVSHWTTSLDPGTAIAPLLVCQQLELAYSLISATIPNLKSFLMSFDTAWMMEVAETPLKSIPYKYDTPQERRPSEFHSLEDSRGLFDLRQDQGNISPGHESLERISTARHPVSERTGSRDGSFASAGSQERIIRCETRLKGKGRQPQVGR